MLAPLKVSCAFHLPDDHNTYGQRLAIAPDHRTAPSHSGVRHTIRIKHQSISWLELDSPLFPG
jgi:hypothetical protein